MTGTCVNDAAASWYARLSSDHMEPSERAAFEAWYASDSAHRMAWDRVERAAQLADEAALSEEARLLVADALAAPARGEGQDDGEDEAADWIEAARTYGEEPQAPPERGARRLVLASLLAAVLGIGTLTFLAYQGGIGGSAGAPEARILATSRGEASRAFTLEDGSEVTLDAASKVRVLPGTAGRTLELTQGQAYFRVAKDAAHPFTVTSGGYRVTALGTEFDVDLRGDGLDVGLVEGRVKVEALGQREHSWTLEPGMVLSIRGDDAQLIEGQASDTRSWMDGRISFDNAPLGDVVARLNRHLAHRLVLDPALEDRVFSGVVRTDDPAALIEALEAYQIARPDVDADGETRLVPY
ncbi:FecR family protein [Novosphingobium sp. MBES04]|uniref:FecR family protein n=1 Tax=Novosphingobium sp. MBES04 TaxID=1206458 RepID=UPI000A006F69|nr:FecR domain-containing protein [Novosphingobium sp. MBES04]